MLHAMHRRKQPCSYAVSRTTGIELPLKGIQCCLTAFLLRCRQCTVPVHASDVHSHMINDTSGGDIIIRHQLIMYSCRLSHSFGRLLTGMCENARVKYD